MCFRMFQSTKRCEARHEMKTSPKDGNLERNIFTSQQEKQNNKQQMITSYNTFIFLVKKQNQNKLLK